MELRSPKIERRGYANRSGAVRDLVRKELVDQTAVSPSAEVFEAVTLIYDHHARLPLDKLAGLQHQYHDAVISSVHVNLDHDNCLDVAARAREIRLDSEVC